MIESELKNIVRIDGVFLFFLGNDMAVFVVLFWEICYTLFCRRNGVEKKIARLDFSGSSRANGRKKCG